MSKDQVLRFLVQAEEKEKKYDWFEAVEFYKKALAYALKQEEFLKAGEVKEGIGYCLYRAAFQAESQEEFKQRLERSTEVYEEAHRVYGKLVDEQKVARMFRCKAVAKYIGYWLTSDPSEKRKLLDECLELEGKALAVFWESDDMLEYGKTYNELSQVFWLRSNLEWDRKTVKSVLERGVEWGEKTVAVVSELGNLYEVARTCLALATCFSCLGNYFIAELEEQEKNRLRTVKHLSKAAEVAGRLGDAYLLGLSYMWLGYNTGGEESVRHFEKTLEFGEQTRDNFLIAWGQDSLAFVTYWKATATDNPQKYRELARKAMQFYEKGQDHYSIMSFMSSRGGFIGAPVGLAEHYSVQAFWETDPVKRMKFLEKSEKLGMEALKLARDSELPWVVMYTLHVVSKILSHRARMERDPAEKRNRLEKALKYREESIKINERLWPFYYWIRGIKAGALAQIKTDLADIEPDFNNKRRLLEEAGLCMENSLELINKTMFYYEKRGEPEMMSELHFCQDSYATLLTRLYNLTNEPEQLTKAIKMSQNAIVSARKLDMNSLIAESYWKIAKAQDVLEDHLEAAESFEHASESYVKAAEQIPQLKGFYQDHASYMQAWSEIEKAKQHHAEKKYGQAKEHYEKAANIYKSTERWNYLTPNYVAWARLEEAEDLSRREQPEEAKGLFQQVAKLFVEAKKSIQAKPGRIETKEEKELMINLTEASDVRREYCLGRTALEEAKILDRQGNHGASSRKYASAVEKFQKASDVTEDESDRQELKPVICLSKAWQMMTRAEAEASADLYREASQLFSEAKEHSADEKAKVLISGHICLCNAFEAGTSFEATRDTMLYSAVKRHLEAAENYYLKAGFKTASAYTRATQRLFDAYMYMDKAETESEPIKKAQFYQMAEKLLQASASSYMKAKHPEKGEEVGRLLESVKEERELAMSLTEVLHAPTITSTTTSFSTPTPHEQAVGLEIFEHAYIQTNLIVQKEDFNVGENLALEIEMVNAGKGTATLVKVEDFIPISEFRIVDIPPAYRVEDGYLNLRGKRLEPLKTEDVKIVAKPQAKGKFTMKPRILYIDETGSYKSHEPEPVTITVKELGIKDWIKGEG